MMARERMYNGVVVVKRGDRKTPHYFCNRQEFDDKIGNYQHRHGAHVSFSSWSRVARSKSKLHCVAVGAA